ncbi:MAG: hydantoinase B/oxoprolinase family protein [Alphaproteobacteria bacterium]
MDGQAAAKPIDGVQLSILNNRLEGIARKMANTLLRTGRSGVLNIARDFSCCIITADAQLLATAESLPIHVLSGPDLMAKSMLEFHPDPKRGDAYLHNSPYHGCSHPADHTLLVPVMDAEGRHRYTVLAKAHQADCGNSQPTTYMGAARDVYEEGALIFPAVKVQENFENIGDIIRMCMVRIRVPEQWWGDYLAMVGAARIGERELLSLADEVGWDTLERFTGQWFDYSESRMANAVAKIPSGRATWTSRHDPVPGTPEDGIPITVKVDVDAEQGRISVDLTDNMDALPCGLNLSEACARTAAMIGVFNSIDPSVPKNAGAFRRLDVKLRENAVCGIPRHPTSCSVATTNVADRVANAVQAAIAELDDGIGLAEAGAILPASVGVVSGYDPVRDERYVNQLFLAMTGGAGAPEADAWVTLGHVGNAGLCYQDSIELDEMRHPLHVHQRRFIQNSEGAGRHKGGPGMLVEFGPTRGEMEVAFVSDGTLNPARGVRGGGLGGAAYQGIRDTDGELTPTENCAVVTLRTGETIVSHCCGGGGYGDPLSREPEKVARDVVEGWVSRDRAADVYGVAVAADGSVDAAATARLRR